MCEVELKSCEMCGALFVRECHPQRWSVSLQKYLEVPRSNICQECVLHPPKEEEPEERPLPVEMRYYRVIGVR